MITLGYANPCREIELAPNGVACNLVNVDLSQVRRVRVDDSMDSISHAISNLVRGFEGTPNTEENRHRMELETSRYLETHAQMLGMERRLGESSEELRQRMMDYLRTPIRTMDISFRVGE